MRRSRSGARGAAPEVSAYCLRAAQVEIPADLLAYGPDEDVVNVWRRVEDFLREALAPEPDNHEERDAWRDWHLATSTRSAALAFGYEWDPAEPEAGL